jgi:hypothetical protein
MTATKHTELYTSIGKGGLYEYIGLSDGAGISKGEQRQVYRCTATGRVFHRECSDFSARMEPVAQSAEPVQGEAVEVVAYMNTASGKVVKYGPTVMDWDDEQEPVESLMTVAQHNRIMAAAKPDAELVGLLSSCRGIVAREVERWNQVAARLLDKGAVESDLLKRIDAKLAELKGGNHASTPV